MTICKTCKNSQARFNYSSETKALYCSDCKLKDMICVTKKNCIVCQVTQPTFNFPSEKTRTHCSKCKVIGMVDLCSRKCIKCNTTCASFNYPNENIPMYCKGCSEEEMINIKSKKCIKCDIKQPNYNFEGEKKATYCSECKLSGMINIVSKKCSSCKSKQPVYNYPNETKAILCFDCKYPDMVNIKDKLCIKCNITRPNYNFEGESKPTHCFKCKDISMVDVKHKKCEFCNYHLCDQKYKPNCATCYKFLNPNSEVVRNYKTKENTIMKFVKEKYSNCVLDSVIQGGCSKRRPDGLIEFEEYSIMIEIDENCHKSYEDICENKRIMEIYRDLGFRPLRILRFNPDSYTNSDNKKVKSIFSVDNKTKKLKVNSQKELNKRVNILLETLEELINNIKLKSDIEKSIDCTYLFYNNA